ncbi:MAG: response regulator, partial [Cyanobacteria bacterium J06648_11]
EDEIITAETIADQLEQLGYAVADTVSSGEAALASIPLYQPDLVLMDIVLKRKRMDGIATAASIRDRFQLPVIYLTAHSDRATLERARVTAPFGYILKPFNEQDLRIAIDMALFKSQAERSLTEQAAFMRTVLRSTDDAIATANADGVVTYLNPAAEALTGWSLSQALGRAIRDIATISDEDAFDTAPETTEHPAEIALRDRKVAYLGDRKVLIRRDGSRVPVGDSASPMFADDGTLEGVVMILWDASDRRAAEQLEREVAERQQIEVDLQDILNVERQLNEQKSRFITTVSHDYRTPLTSIRTATALLEQFGPQLSDVQRRTYLTRIQAAVQQMTQLIDEVLTFERAAAKRLDR